MRKATKFGGMNRKILPFSELKTENDENSLVKKK